MIAFEIKNDTEVNQLQYKLVVKYLFGKSKKNILRLLIVGLVFLTLGLVAGSDDGNYFNPFTLISFIWLFLSFIFGFFLFFILKKMKTIHERIMQESNENDLIQKFEFNDEGIKISSTNYTSEIKWNGIKNYSEIEENIFIMRTKHLDSSFAIGKRQVSEEVYLQILELLKEKVEYKEYKI